MWLIILVESSLGPLRKLSRSIFLMLSSIPRSCSEISAEKCIENATSGRRYLISLLRSDSVVQRPTRRQRLDRHGIN